MLIKLLLLILGLALVVAGANILVEGASAFARRFGVSEFVIGLTIVGFGTSLPELVVSVTGALQGNSAIAIGNVVGSNLFNVLFILAVSALVSPIVITRSNHYRDIPITLAATVLVVALGMAGNGLSRIEGAVMLVLFACYILYCFRSDKPEEPQEDAGAASTQMSAFLAVTMILGGLSGLIFGGRLFVNSAEDVALMLGVSDKFIAITVLAMGTSLPEFVTSIVALSKQKSQMAMGNILGSNVFNLLLILGTSALISPMSFASMSVIDMSALVLSALMVFLSIYIGKKNLIDRLDGSMMLLAFAAYMVWLFIKL